MTRDTRSNPQGYYGDSNDDTRDSDSDGMADSLEVEFGTSSWSDDTDDDGLADASEISAGTSPTNADTDGDGYTDHQEFVNGVENTGFNNHAAGFHPLAPDAGISAADWDANVLGRKSNHPPAIAMGIVLGLRDAKGAVAGKANCDIVHDSGIGGTVGDGFAPPNIAVNCADNANTEQSYIFEPRISSAQKSDLVRLARNKRYGTAVLSTLMWLQPGPDTPPEWFAVRDQIRDDALGAATLETLRDSGYGPQALNMLLAGRNDLGDLAVTVAGAAPIPDDYQTRWVRGAADGQPGGPNAAYGTAVRLTSDLKSDVLATDGPTAKWISPWSWGMRPIGDSPLDSERPVLGGLNSGEWWHRLTSGQRGVVTREAAVPDLNSRWDAYHGQISDLRLLTIRSGASGVDPSTFVSDTAAVATASGAKAEWWFYPSMDTMSLGPSPELRAKLDTAGITYRVFPPPNVDAELPYSAAMESLAAIEDADVDSSLEVEVVRALADGHIDEIRRTLRSDGGGLGTYWARWQVPVAQRTSWLAALNGTGIRPDGSTAPCAEADSGVCGLLNRRLVAVNARIEEAEVQRDAEIEASGEEPPFELTEPVAGRVRNFNVTIARLSDEQQALQDRLGVDVLDNDDSWWDSVRPVAKAILMIAGIAGGGTWVGVGAGLALAVIDGVEGDNTGVVLGVLLSIVDVPGGVASRLLGGMLDGTGVLVGRTDAAGTVIGATRSEADSLENLRLALNPAEGWTTDPAIAVADLAKTPATVPYPWIRKYWTKFVEFEGRRVYQRDDIIDPARLDPDGETTNLDLMRAGKAPYGPDGKKIVLHHVLQTDKSPLAEVTQSLHGGPGTFRIIHINPDTMPSDINRSAFGVLRSRYWMARACDFGEC